MKEKIKEWFGSERNRVVTFVLTLFIVFTLVFGMSLSGVMTHQGEYKVTKIPTENGGTALVKYDTETGEPLAVSMSDDTEVGDELDLWGSTKISDSHIGVDWVALPDNGNISFGDDTDLQIWYDATNNTLEHSGSWGSIDAEQGSIKNANQVLYAPEYADSGSGTDADPYVDAISNAIANLSDEPNEAVIYVAKGHYEETTPITYSGQAEDKPRHLAIIGHGFWDSYIELADGFDDTFLEFTNDSAPYIKGIQIDGKKDNQIEAHPIIHLNNTMDSYIYECFITSSKGDGIKLTDTWTTRIIDNAIEYCENNGIYIYSSNTVRHTYIKQNTIIDNENYQIELDGDGSNNVETIIAEQKIKNNVNSNPVIKITNLAQRLMIKDNWLQQFNSGDAILHDTIVTNGLHITGNQVNAGTFINTSSSLSDCIVKDNTLQSGTSTGFGSNSGGITGTTIWKDNLNGEIGLDPHGSFIVNDEISWGGALSSDAVPTSETTYTVKLAPVRVIISGGTVSDITVKDADGDTVVTGKSEIDMVLRADWTLNCTYTDAPSATTIFR